MKIFKFGTVQQKDLVLSIQKKKELENGRCFCFLWTYDQIINYHLIENLIQSERVELSMAGLEIKPRTPAILDRCAIQTDN